MVRIRTPLDAHFERIHIRFDVNGGQSMWMYMLGTIQKERFPSTHNIKPHLTVKEEEDHLLDICIYIAKTQSGVQLIVWCG